MRLPNPPAQYSASSEAQRNQILEREDGLNFKKTADVEIVDPQRLILRSPDGTKYVISVDNSGVLSATAL